MVLVLRHDPAVGQVWTLTEVCSACAPLMTHARVVALATPRARQEVPESPQPVVERPVAGPEVVAAGAEARAVPGGFSAPAAVAAVPAEDARRGGGLRRRRGR